MANFDDLAGAEKLAQRRLPRSIFRSVLGGVDEGRTLDRNSQAFDEITFSPQAATATTHRDLRTRVLGTEVALPVLIGPVGSLRLIHPSGALAAARAAGKVGTICAVSMNTDHSLDDVAAASTGPIWQQVYVENGREAVETAMEGAQNAGCSALVVTIDLPAFKRGRKVQFNLRSILTYTPELVVRPRWSAAFFRDGMRLASANTALGARAKLGEPPISWADFSWIRDRWK